MRCLKIVIFRGQLLSLLKDFLTLMNYKKVNFLSHLDIFFQLVLL